MRNITIYPCTIKYSLLSLLLLLSVFRSCVNVINIVVINKNCYHYCNQSNVKYDFVVFHVNNDIMSKYNWWIMSYPAMNHIQMTIILSCSYKQNWIKIINSAIIYDLKQAVTFDWKYKIPWFLMFLKDVILIIQYHVWSLRLIHLIQNYIEFELKWNCTVNCKNILYW